MAEWNKTPELRMLQWLAVLVGDPPSTTATRQSLEMRQFPLLPLYTALDASRVEMRTASPIPMKAELLMEQETITSMAILQRPQPAFEGLNGVVQKSALTNASLAWTAAAPCELP